ncbi:hypothetical protein BCR36DRAFT_218751, partial [Piromyces finnis]
YERSERLSSSMTSDLENRKAKILRKNVLNRCQEPLYKLLSVMQIITTLSIIIGTIGIIFYTISFSSITTNIKLYTTVSRSPYIVGDIQRAVRILSLATASGIDPSDMMCTKTINNSLDFIETVYIPTIYKSHTLESHGYTTINPIENGVVDRLLDINYYKTISKIDRKARIIIERSN